MSKFKIGDTVRVVKEVTHMDRQSLGKAAKINGIAGLEMYSLEGVPGFMRGDQLKLVKSFTKSDMQVGQMYKTRNGRICTWRMEDVGYYANDLTWNGNGPQEDVIEVYPFPLTPIWKREEPKYRVKTELTKEQAEKLGLEFCEVVE